MKQTIALLIGSAWTLCAADMTVATLYDSQLRIAESEVVSLAQAMPESAYNFARMKGVIPPASASPPAAPQAKKAE